MSIFELEQQRMNTFMQCCGKYIPEGWKIASFTCSMFAIKYPKCRESVYEYHIKSCVGPHPTFTCFDRGDKYIYCSGSWVQYSPEDREILTEFSNNCTQNGWPMNPP